MDDKTKELLNEPLQEKYVSQRKAQFGTLSYIEQHHAIREANRIFGFDGWERETREMVQIGDIYKNTSGKHKVVYRAKVMVHALGCFREGTGFGSGIGSDIGDIHEVAIKEAESDAMKRALITFGDQFGLALYDKEQKHVSKDSDGEGVQSEYFEQTKAKFMDCKTLEELEDFFKIYYGNRKHVSTAQHDELLNIKNGLKGELK